jgi:Flp pilus assembly protein TadB
VTSTNGGNPARSPFAHPYRDTVLVYAGLAVLLVVVVVLTGGSVVWALLAAAVAFLLAVGWTWRSTRAREREEQ